MSHLDEDHRYIINARWTLNLGKRFFFVFMFGPDIRSHKLSTNVDRRKHSTLGKTIVYSGIFACAILSLLVFLVGLLYILKSRMGIDLIEEGHPIPEFLRSLGFCH